MATSAKQYSLFLVLTLLSFHTHARDSQFFNKIPSTTNTVVIPNNNNKEASLTNQQEQQQDPTFLPQNENAYGLYGHESGQLPSSATTTGEPTTTTTPYNTQIERQPVHKYLPKNYNPVAYVTQPEGLNDETNKFAEEKSYTANPNNNNNNYYYNNNNQQEKETEYKSYPTTTARTNNNNNYYNGGMSSFNSQQPQGMSDTRYSTGAALNSRERYSNTGGGFEPQGMSDTRFVENGKYFYDVNTEKYSSSHPYESLRGVQTRNEYSGNRNYYGNVENSAYELNGENSVNGGYQNEEEQFQEEDNGMP